MANLRDGCLAEGALGRPLQPAEEAQVVKVAVPARDYLAGLGDALEADDAALGVVVVLLLSGGYLLERALEDLALEVVA